MRRIAVIAAVSMAVAVAGPGCTVIGAGTGAIAAGVANHFIAPDAPHRVSVSGTAAAGAIMGLIVDVLVLSALGSTLDDIFPHHEHPGIGDR